VLFSDFYNPVGFSAGAGFRFYGISFRWDAGGTGVDLTPADRTSRSAGREIMEILPGKASRKRKKVVDQFELGALFLRNSKPSGSFALELSYATTG